MTPYWLAEAAPKLPRGDSGAPVDVGIVGAGVTGCACALALAEAGLRVPSDVALIGYDDVAQAAVTVPPLTTVAQPIGAMAERALELLLGERPLGSALLPPRLVVRASG